MIRYAVETDFDWIYKLHQKNKFLLGPCYPSLVRKQISQRQIIVSDNCDAFCDFHLPKKGNHIAIYTLCVDNVSRRKGIGTELVNFIRSNYSYPIKIVCPSDSDANEFWKSCSKQIGEKKSRNGKLLFVYYITDIYLRRRKLF